ncbi:hypothetical protein [Acaryochloris sp. IP29b_bin.148]|uniref:hypothetical protein n=1 Tax=Acaryochloris sp. IP29b_bin.148 TaxID=2969218 RepID=UPI002615D7CD|nr:hypothetical protein [Acaryochloris sp. IP29b_bin.148]
MKASVYCAGGTEMLRPYLTGLSASLLMVMSPLVSQASELPIVESAVLGIGKNPPWSEPVQVEDPFEGQFIAVFDRHRFSDRFLNTHLRIEVQSLWTQDYVRLLLTAKDRDCYGHHGFLSSSYCSELIDTKKIVKLFVKIDEQIYQVSGQHNTFPVNSELASALSSASEQDIQIRLVTESGASVDSKIGPKTVKAWQTLYQPAVSRSLN